jgi:hypothetical protein
MRRGPQDHLPHGPGLPGYVPWGEEGSSGELPGGYRPKRRRRVKKVPPKGASPTEPVRSGDPKTDANKDSAAE